MGEYIEREALKKHLASYAGMFTDELGFVVRLEAVLGGIDFQPAVDAVEVVRCKDCLFYMCDNGCPLHESGYFKNGKMLPFENDFCSYGERRNDSCVRVPRYDIYGVQIIGNIHDNPELIGGNDEKEA